MIKVWQFNVTAQSLTYLTLLRRSPIDAISKITLLLNLFSERRNLRNSEVISLSMALRKLLDYCK